MSLSPAVGRQRKADLWIWGQPSTQEFWESHVDCLKRINEWMNGNPFLENYLVDSYEQRLPHSVLSLFLIIHFLHNSFVALVIISLAHHLHFLIWLRTNNGSYTYKCKHIAWSTKGALGQLGLCTKTLSQKQTAKPNQPSKNPPFIYTYWLHNYGSLFYSLPSLFLIQG